MLQEKADCAVDIRMAQQQACGAGGSPVSVALSTGGPAVVTHGSGRQPLKVNK
jgi:hypothetical protein